MKITLIQIDLIMGARLLVSLLRQKGYDVKALQINMRYTDLLTEEDLDIIYDYVSDSEVVGLSFNTFYAVIAKQLAVYLKKRGIRSIITGGNHATALPDEAIQYSDIVVKYEAEITLQEVIDALKKDKDLSGIKGIHYKHNGRVFRNDGPPDIVWELDALPFQSVDTALIKYFTPKRKVYTADKKDLFPHKNNAYFLLASRGCPFECTYCSNSLYHKINAGFKRVRKRSVNNILNEMEYAVSNGFGSFYITDDHFFSFTAEELEYFSGEYSRRIKKPFSVVGINPNNFRSPFAEKKIRLLLDCGLSDIRIGVQSGSNRTLDMFRRNYKAEEIPELVSIIEKHRNTIWPPPHDKLHVALDFICDAVWETEDDKIATIKLAQKALKQYSIYFYTLVYLPGTKLYEEAVRNDWIADNINDIYLRGIAGVDDNIYNRILFLIAITKERNITLSDRLIDHILELSRTDIEKAKHIIDSFIYSVNSLEKHHGLNLEHAATHPYLTGFKEWTKTAGQTGRKVLFRSYHEAYG